MRKEASPRGYLLDTHTVIWALDRPEKLSAPALKVVSAGPLVLSVISYWEVAVKSMKGKLDVGDPRAWWLEALDQLNATSLPLRPEHVGALCGLPAIHSDLFDRALIAQAMVERMVLVTGDSKIGRYASERFTVIC